MNRVSSLDDIAVEIENFDVDLLSKRALNITGVLSLKGIQAAAPGARDQVWANEEFTVVHAPEATDLYSNGGASSRQPVRPASWGTHPDANSTSPSYFNEAQTRAQESGTDARTQQYLASWAQYENQTRIHRTQQTAPLAFLKRLKPGIRSNMPYIMRRKLSAESSIPSVWQFERVAVQPEPEQEDSATSFPGVIERKGEEVDAVPVLESPETEEVPCFR